MIIQPISERRKKISYDNKMEGIIKFQYFFLRYNNIASTSEFSMFSEQKIHDVGSLRAGGKYFSEHFLLGFA